MVCKAQKVEVAQVAAAAIAASSIIAGVRTQASYRLYCALHRRLVPAARARGLLGT